MDKINNKHFKWDVPVSALEKWDRSIKAASDDEYSINIYSTIGDYGDGQGMTARIVSSILRKADGNDVTVNINSGGGDFFEGLAINSLLSGYDGKVKVRVLGLAASAASVVALAGDEVEIAENGFFMIHNAWTIAMGNKNIMNEAADMLDKFDASMVALYSKRTKIDEKTIAKMMNSETWLNGEEAVELNFANAILGGDKIGKDEDETISNAALRKADVALAKAGMSRTDRRALLKELTSTPSAAETVKPSADTGLETALQGLLKTLKQGT
jgi:ATP-dependent protease ClpP protease subunit